LERIDINLGNRISSVYTDESIRNIGKYASPEKSIIITDTNLDAHYSQEFAPYRKIVIGTGEAVKTLSTVEKISLELVNHGADRNTFILGIGGGIVSDIAGFTASVYMRGLKFGFVSTSLLSQVDASVGGKNGVNLQGLKNMLGLFNQPEFVICDHEMLSTLPRYEYINGIAELVKTACLDSEGLFEFISDNRDKILAKDRDAVHESVLRCVRFKASVVEEDERESGLRRILNLGHTAGHAIEKITGTGHGYAIAAGMGFVCDLSAEMGIMKKDEGEKIKSLLEYFGLPSNIKGIPGADDIPALAGAIAADKKKGGASVAFVLLEEAGKPVIKNIPLNDVENLIRKNIETGGV
jgi:3-dehydroquinate synthase